MNATLIGLLLMIMNMLGMNTVNVDQLEEQYEMALIEEQELQEARENGIQVLEPIELFFMYGNEDGMYWLDPSSEYENVIYVDYGSLAEWNIDYNTLEHGTMMIGLFDETGWELIELLSEESLIEESNEANR